MRVLQFRPSSSFYSWLHIFTNLTVVNVSMFVHCPQFLKNFKALGWNITRYDHQHTLGKCYVTTPDILVKYHTLDIMTSPQQLKILILFKLTSFNIFNRRTISTIFQYKVKCDTIFNFEKSSAYISKDDFSKLMEN